MIEKSRELRVTETSGKKVRDRCPPEYQGHSLEIFQEKSIQRAALRLRVVNRVPFEKLIKNIRLLVCLHRKL